MDTLTRTHRSWNMSRIRSGNTKPEISVRSVLHRMGYRFRSDSGKKLFGRPDIVLPRHSTVVFVHGCFWHRHRNCKYAYMPRTRVAFWKKKFHANIIRDRIVEQTLKKAGWKVVIVWEDETIDAERLCKILKRKMSVLHRKNMVLSAKR